MVCSRGEDQILKPVYGQGIFYLFPNGLITYLIIFDYIDPELEYFNLLKNNEDLLDKEIASLKENMQRFLDEEKMLINGKRVKSKVREAWIEIRGDPKRPSIMFLIEMYFEPSLKGRILYEDYYNEETAEYDYTVHWIFPVCIKVLDYNITGYLKLKQGHLEIKVKKGSRTSDYESILFDASSCGGT